MQIDVIELFSNGRCLAVSLVLLDAGRSTLDAGSKEARKSVNPKAQILNPQLITGAGQWDAALVKLPVAHFLQTWEWGALKSRYGWQPTRYLWMEGERSCAATSVLTRRLGRWPSAVMYIPKGPVLDYGDTALLDSGTVRLAGRVSHPASNGGGSHPRPC